VLLLIFTVDEYVIKVYDQKFANEGSQYLSHYFHKRSKIICQSKLHNYPLIQTILRLEGSLPFITKANSNLVITTLQIYLGEYFGSHHHI